MPIKIGRTLKARLERPYMTTFWGVRRKVKPVLIDRVLGNGNKLISVTPLNTRPQYYLIRIDSTWQTSNFEDGQTVGQNLEEIYQVIEEECGRRHEDKYESPTGRPRVNPWPAFDDSGTSWHDASDLLKRKAT